MKSFVRDISEPVLNYGKCLSACAFAWLGGTKRYLGGFAEIGFYHPFLEKGVVPNDTTGAITNRAMEIGLGVINSYLVSTLDLNKQAAGYVTVMPPKSVNYLNQEDGEKYGIEFTRTNVPGYDPLP